MNKLTYPKALTLPFRAAPIESAVIILIQLISLAIAPILVLATAHFIDTAIATVTYGLDFSYLLFSLGVLVVLTIYGYITSPVTNLLSTKSSIKFSQKHRMPMVNKRAGLEFKHLENPKTKDLIERVWGNLEGNLNGIFGNFQGFVSMVGHILSYSVILLINAPIAGIILIVLAIPVFIINYKAGKSNYQAFRDVTINQRYVWNIGGVLTRRETVSERNMFGYAKYLGELYNHHVEVNRKHLLKVSTKWWLRSTSTSTMLGLLSASSLFLMLPSVADGSLSVGLFIALQGALFSVIGWVAWGLSNHFMEFARQREFLKEFNEFMELSEVDDANSLPRAIVPKFETLEFKNVSFSYPGTDKMILNNLSLLMESGKQYSFVGVNGAGKTTITKLITRLYDNYTGEILLNGKSIREWDMADLKACFCALFQDFSRFDVSIAENTAIGKINNATEDEINEALRLSGFDKKAEQFKDGIHTKLGKTHEGSVDLSGGQWQRLAFSRAIINPAPVKILDEPTAALDPVAEAAVYAQFEEISRGFTTIFISHRLASAKLAHKIFVLDGGKVAEEGNHQQLMQHGGIYAEMFESQKSWYTNEIATGGAINA